jgi:hypothetical protein
MKTLLLVTTVHTTGEKNLEKKSSNRRRSHISTTTVDKISRENSDEVMRREKSEIDLISRKYLNF